MKKSILLVSVVVAVMMTGCGLKNGEIKESYKPVSIDNAQESDQAYIKAAGKLLIWSVDGVRKVNFVKLSIGIGIDSIKIKEGYHTLRGTLGVDINIGKVFYKKGHEYLIDYAYGDRKYGRQEIHYWVMDLTDNKVVYGKEFK